MERQITVSIVPMISLSAIFSWFMNKEKLRESNTIARALTIAERQRCNTKSGILGYIGSVKRGYWILIRQEEEILIKDPAFVLQEGDKLFIPVPMGCEWRRFSGGKLLYGKE